MKPNTVWNTHPQQNVLVVKSIKVDAKIVPIVKWLNSFDEVFTLYSCQGEPECRAYVLFHCMCAKDLAFIYDKVKSFGKYETSVKPFYDYDNSCYDHSRHLIEFNASGLDELTKYLCDL